MKRSKFSEEQIALALRQAEAGTPVTSVCRHIGVSEATFYPWKTQPAHSVVAVPSLTECAQSTVLVRVRGSPRRQTYGA